MADPLLDLSTLTERDTIRIDGTVYELRGRGELSILDAHRFRRAGRRIQQLMEDVSPDDDGLRELGELTDQTVAAVVIDLPDEVLAKLAPAQKWAIVSAFTLRSMPAPEQQEAMPDTESQDRATA